MPYGFGDDCGEEAEKRRQAGSYQFGFCYQDQGIPQKQKGQEKEFGIQIDSLADTVNFVVLPVIIMISLGMTSVIDVIIYMLFDRTIFGNVWRIS